MSHISREGKILIITSWFRTLVQSNISIVNISNIIVDFCKMFEQFDESDEKWQYRINITDNGRIARKICTGNCSIYCKFIIPNQTKEIFNWRFKCCNMTDPKRWGIGIDAVENKPQYNWHFYSGRRNVSYFYKANGDIWNCGGVRYKKKTAGWSEGDIITMIYNGRARTLSISINEVHDQNSTLTCEQIEGYRVAVFMHGKEDMIELL